MSVLRRGSLGVWAELAKEGWERHHARGEPVHLCGGCSQAYEEARKLEKIPTREKI